MFLIDTNCWMEIARHRPRTTEVTQFLTGVPTPYLRASVFSVHGMGVLFRRHKMSGQYGQFLAQTSIATKVNVLAIPIPQLGLVDDTCTTRRLDFDDAYQHVVTELNNLKIVSFDADFDRTPRGRLEPLAALAHYQATQKQNP